MKRLVAVASIVVVLGALAAGFYLVGPPAEERTRRLDARREADLQHLRRAIDLYWTRNARLPATLQDLHEAGTSSDDRDPESGQLYPYIVKGGDTYELCADFGMESELPGGFWSHGAGRQCFQVTAKGVEP